MGSEIEQFLEFFIQSDAEDQSQFCGGVELTGFDGGDGIAGYADHFCQRRLGQVLLRPDLPDAVFENQLVVHGTTSQNPAVKQDER